jgi:hypothetical protein
VQKYILTVKKNHAKSQINDVGGGTDSLALGEADYGLEPGRWAPQLSLPILNENYT